MKKYYYIFKLNIMSNLQYVLNIMIGFITYFIIIFIMLNLWQYIYSDSSKLINGYKVSQMIWYVIFTEFLWFSIDGSALCKHISSDVKGGNIAYNMNKPYSYIGYVISNHLGEIVVKATLYGVAGFVMGLLLIGGIPNFNITIIPLILIVTFFAIIINSFLLISIGLLAFWIEDSNPFYWLYSKMILVLGTLFPIEFFPAIMRPFLTYSPVYVISYGPAKLFIDFSFTVFFQVVIMQIVYIIISYYICTSIYKKGVQKLNVNGG